MTYEGVVCPDFIREQWKEALVVDLDPSYPLDIIFTEEGLDVDLSFNGYVTRCSFPWESIYVVADRETGKGLMLEQNMPESVLRKRKLVLDPETAPSSVKASKESGAKGESRRHKRRKTPEEQAPVPETPSAPLGLARVEPVAEDPIAKDKVDSETGAQEKEALRRRSGFRVIEGGS